jgi:hypothetical protein
MTDQKQPQNVEYFSYFVSMIKIDGRCTCEIKSGIATTKAEFNKGRLFISKLDLNGS